MIKVNTTPTEWELTDEDNELVAKFELFDAHSIVVYIHEKILTPDELRLIADELDKVYKQYVSL